jgi:hypothetical protein
LSDDLPGDFNHDGFVNLTDYTVWRNGLGTIYFADDYDDWKLHFGESTENSFSPAVVPEPASWITAGGACAGLIRRGRRRERVRAVINRASPGLQAARGRTAP